MIPQLVMVTNAIKCVHGMKPVMVLVGVVLRDLAFVIPMLEENFSASARKVFLEISATSHARQTLIALVMDGVIMMACASATIGMQMKLAPGAPLDIGVQIVSLFVITWRHVAPVADVRTLASAFAHCPPAVPTVRIARMAFSEMHARSRAIGTRPVVDMAAALRMARVHVTPDTRDQVWHACTCVFFLCCTP